MNRPQSHRRRLGATFLTLGFSALLLVAGLSLGCEKKTVNNVTGPPPPVIIGLDGQCRAGIRRIACEDDSTSTPRGQIESISFALRNQETGIPVESRNVSPSSVPPRETTFSGVAAGTYEVTHRVVGTDGRTSQKVYSDLVVTAF